MGEGAGLVVRAALSGGGALSREQRARADAIFDAALDLAPEERASFVAARCAGDGALHGQVQALLAAHERTDGILEEDPRRLLGEERTPARLGVYRLGRAIGQGGMGVVYEAERDDGQFLRRVAIKVLRAGEDDDVRRRVLAERQILAGLDHPNIARLLDGGVSSDGRPYLVMEHIEGLPLDVYCDRMRLTVTERLRLFVVIARTVAYAHRNLVVHRDLKPSNILVTADGVVKLLDFGVAKLLNPGLAGASHTLDGRLAFTPDYASPEQLRGDALTTQADVFALGVLLYELLAGRRPFAAAGLAGLIREVAEREPERPSARVRRDEALPVLDGGTREVTAVTVAHARQTSPARLARALRGDLDAIVALALAKEPRARYGSAELLADDIGRHLSAEPVRARRRGRAYAFGRFVRRHRGPVAAVALGAVSIVLGAGGALWQARAAGLARDRAESARSHAEQVTRFMIELFEAGAPGGGGSGVIEARDLVRRGTARIEQLADQPEVQAHLLGALGRVHDAMGEYEQGQRLLERAVAVFGATEPVDPNDVAADLLQLGIIQRRRSVYDSAEQNFTRARVLLAGTARPDPALFGKVLSQLSSIAIYRSDLAEAERRMREGVALQEERLGPDHPLTLNNLRELGSVLWRRGDPEAERVLRRVIQLRSSLPNPDRAELALDRLQLAELLATENRSLAEAEDIFRQTVETMRPDVPEEWGALNWAAGSLADRLLARGEYAAAERLLRESVERHRSVFGTEHPAYGGVVAGLGHALLLAGRLAEADSLYHEEARIQARVFGPRHASYSSTLLNLAELAEARGQVRRADSLVAASNEVRAQRNGRQSLNYVLGLQQRARLQLRLGDPARAEAMLREAIELATPQVHPRSRHLRSLHQSLADVYAAWNRPADAARHRRLARP